MSNKSEGFIEKLWSVFSSMKTGVVLLGVVALVSGIGTIIPQEASDPEGAMAVSSFWKTLGFTNLYGSALFQLLMGLLCINLIVCSIQRFGSIYRLTFKSAPPQTTGNVPSRIQTKISVTDDNTIKQGIQDLFKSRGFRLISSDNDNKWGFIAQKRRLGNWGSFVTHLSFVILILGALIGSITGFKGFLMAGEGDIVPIRSIDLEKGSISENFSVKVNSVEDRILDNGERDNWYSDLSIIESGKEVVRKTISVNHPLTYDGVTFYQASYAPGAKLTVDIQGQKIPVVLQNRGGNYFQAPGTDLYLILAAMKTDPKEPVILYQVYKGDSEQPIAMGQLTPGQSENIVDTYTLTFDAMSGYTGLQVKKDPGVSVVWLGSGLLMLGLIVSFYWRPITISGVIENQKEPVLIMGALTGKLNLGIQNEFDQIVSELKEKTQPTE